MAYNTYPCNPWPISTEQLNKGNNDDLNTRVAALEGDVSDLNDTKANQITIAPFFDPEASYEVGDLVYYNGLTYRCTNDHEGEWDADDFAATTISNELDSLKSGLDNLANPLGTYNVMGIFQTSQLYNNSYGIAVVTGFDPSIHTATINSASTLDGTNLTLTYNPHSTKKGVVGFFVADATVLGKIVNINITVS